MRLLRKNSGGTALIMRSGNGSGCAMNDQCQEPIAQFLVVLFQTWKVGTTSMMQTLLMRAARSLSRQAAIHKPH
jgi:hypothetical protein